MTKLKILSLWVIVLAALTAGTPAVSPAEPVPARILKELRVLTDRCSNSVWISPNYYSQVSNPPGGIFLNSLERSDKEEPDAEHPFSEKMTIKRFGPNRYVRWYCGTTRERSRCPRGTRAVQGWLGPDRKLLIRCLS